MQTTTHQTVMIHRGIGATVGPSAVGLPVLASRLTLVRAPPTAAVLQMAGVTRSTRAVVQTHLRLHESNHSHPPFPLPDNAQKQSEHDRENWRQEAVQEARRGRVQRTVPRRSACVVRLALGRGSGCGDLTPKWP